MNALEKVRTIKEEISMKIKLKLKQQRIPYLATFFL